MFAVHSYDQPELKSFMKRKCRMMASSPDTFVCRICERTFNKQYNLLMHERMHKDENDNSYLNRASSSSSGLYPCTVCGKIFGRADTMRNHRALHSPPAVPKALKGFMMECVTY